MVLCELGSVQKRPKHDDSYISQCLSDIGEIVYKPAFQIGVDMLYRIAK